MTTTEQALPTPRQAIDLLTQIKGVVTYPDIDATTDEGARALLARWQCVEAAILSLANLVGTAQAVQHQLATGEAAEGDERDLQWCAAQLAEALGE